MNLQLFLDFSVGHYWIFLERFALLFQIHPCSNRNLIGIFKIAWVLITYNAFRSKLIMVTALVVIV